MFNGIIETTARVAKLAESPAGRRITLSSTWTDLSHGESIAVNGCCLTVADLPKNQVAFDVIPETLAKTNLGLLKAGDEVHLERSLRVGDRISGHFVQGHIDGTAKLVERRTEGGEFRLVIESPPELAKYLQPKGSVCLDGVSLTVASISFQNKNPHPNPPPEYREREESGKGGTRFEVALIPTTLQLTLLRKREIGWPFNLEADILSKTIIYWLECRQI